MQRVASYFAFLVTSCLIVFVGVELVARVMLAHHDARPVRPEEVPTAYREYPWAVSIFQDERRRFFHWRTIYEPFRIWGNPEWKSEYQNYDRDEFGIFRRTRTGNSDRCEGKLKEVWFFGGSTMMGAFSADVATIPSYAASELGEKGKKCYRIRNFGVEGYASNQETILLVEFLRAGRRPEMVVFLDGTNETYVLSETGNPLTHLEYNRIKARFEGSNLFWRTTDQLASIRLMKGILTTVTAAISRAPVVPSTPVSTPKREIAATPASLENEALKNIARSGLDNYLFNRRMVELLGREYGFRSLFFWQPNLFYGDRRLEKEERALLSHETPWTRGVIATTYEEAENRAKKSKEFVFLGRLFDTVQRPLYVADWIHPTPQGNQVVAHAIAREILANME